jgi:hypothetical protein
MMDSQLLKETPHPLGADEGRVWANRAGPGWAILILVLALATAWLVYFDAPGPLRATVVLTFLLLCPGVAFTPLLSLRDTTQTVILGVAMSLALNLIVAAVVLYAGLWSSLFIMTIVIALSLTGALWQGVRWARSHGSPTPPMSVYQVE